MSLDQNLTLLLYMSFKKCQLFLLKIGNEYYHFLLKISKSYKDIQIFPLKIVIKEIKPELHLRLKQVLLLIKRNSL